MSKSFAGTALRILIEEGKVDLEALASKYLEGLPEPWAHMKIRQLVTMSSGYGDDWGTEFIPYEADVVTPVDDLGSIKIFSQLKQLAPVGSEYHYCSANYALMGMVVEKVSGQRLAAFVDQRIFKPAGMSQSSYNDNAAIVPERAEGYRPVKDGFAHGRFLGQYLHARADVGILTTARDVARYIAALQSGKIVNGLTKLWEPTISDTGRALDYSYGWFTLTHLGHRLIAHSGGFRTGFTTNMSIFPDDDTSIVVLTNSDACVPKHVMAMAAHVYIPGILDPLAHPAPDPDPSATQVLLRSLKGLADGKVDLSVMTPDCYAPVSLDDFAPITGMSGGFYVGGGQCSMTVHGHALVRFLTVGFKVDGAVEYVSAYYDASGKIALLEPTG